MLNRHFILELDEFPLHPTLAHSAETIEPEIQECRMVDRADSVVPLKNETEEASTDSREKEQRQQPKLLDG